MAEFLFDISDASFGAARVLPKIHEGIEADVGFLHYLCWTDKRAKVIPAGGVDTFRFHMKIPEREVWYLRGLKVNLDNQELDGARWKILTPGHEWDTINPTYRPSTNTNNISESKDNLTGSTWGDNRDELSHRAIFGGEFLEFSGTFGKGPFIDEDHIKVALVTIRAWLPDKLQRQYIAGAGRDQNGRDQILKNALSRLDRTSFGT